MTGSRLLDILRKASPAYQLLQEPALDLGIAEVEPFPFLAIVGHEEMKLALLLAVINPSVGGVLLSGSRGTAKTTAVRGLADLLPRVRRSLCPDGQGCTEERILDGGMDAVCQACAERYGYGEPLTAEVRAKLVDLPLSARLDDVVGSINERIALEQQRVRLEPGILAQADGNILYVDEINLLDAKVADAILDAAAQGYYTVRRGPLNLTYKARFLLIGSMNPEEGELGPQLLDRFGLRTVVRGLANKDDRFLAYENAMWYRRDPEGIATAYAEQMLALMQELEQAQRKLPAVELGPEAREHGLRLVERLKIDSSRAEIALFESARAYAAAEGRAQVLPEDIGAVALPALRLRRSTVLANFYKQLDAEDETIRQAWGNG